MKKKRLCLFALAILLSFSAYAQYEPLAGISAESPEYDNYQICIDSCSQCETNCKTSAYRMAAETQQKEELCNYLPDAEKQPCLNRIHMSKAIAGKDSAECQKITEDNEKQGCLLNVQTEKAINKESESECAYLPEGFAESCRQAFYMRMASLKTDESYCSKISDETAKTICMDNAKMQKGIKEPAAEPGKEEPPAMKPNASKKLIIYGSIIFTIIILAVLAFVIIKKISRKKAAPEQKQGPPLVLQKEPVQQLPKANAPEQVLDKQKIGGIK